MKRILIFVTGLLLLGSTIAPGEELITVAVVDINRVAMAFFRNSSAVREIERFKTEIQEEVNRLTAEIKALQEQKLQAQEAGNEERALTLDQQIYQKTQYLRDYYRVKTQQLEERQRKLTESSTFLQELKNALEYVAETHGFSVIFKSTDPDLLWWHKEVDITDLVIERLMGSAR
ncbi:OmpH family outer membrane protein [Spirochaeta thermophila]|uniref:Outer membrane chaperone Skp (OmpH) n=1 Tax=Winmispira thermophila (strain ATCC 49972 / DSM 6192 / RI 19.B1) TaxID=665571 RepID=E0RST2_WINT6|nr:OmpH family outer membrane protein [Spirochaeta thermophila]ADN02069.1 hypothetical protein STHERM_c11240 [Spirochaeta thermophila DSM 6192]